MTLRSEVPPEDLQTAHARQAWIDSAKIALKQIPLVVDVSGREWRKSAHPNQLRPEQGTWVREWYLRGSRRSGKTYGGSNNFADLILSSPPNEWAVVGPTFADARDTLVESMRSGLVKALGGKVIGGKLVDKGEYIQGWNRSMGQLYLTNGSVVFCDGADDGALRIQGKGLAGCWGDEIGLWRAWRTAYDESIYFAVTEPPAKVILTGTPKANMPARVLVRRLLDDDKVAKSWLKLEQNRENLDSATVDELLKLSGTRLGRQEVLGELLETVEGALWTQDTIDRNRLERIPEGVDLVRVVIPIDPAGTAGEDSDETGITVCALGSDGHGYLLADLSGRYTPDGWARKAVTAYEDYKADLILGEVNNGGDMVGHTVHTVSPTVGFKVVRATRGKVLRAEPIAAAYEQARVHHVGPPEMFEPLEVQMTQCVPGQEQEHDDRLDSMVYGMTELGLIGTGVSWEEVYSASSGDEKERETQEEANPWDEVYG